MWTALRQPGCDEAILQTQENPGSEERKEEMRKLKKRNGAWTVLVDLGWERDPATGKRNRKQFRFTHRGKKVEAEQKLNEKINKIFKKEFVEPNTISFGQWLDLWVENSIKPPVKRLRTYESYKSIIDCHLKPKLEEEGGVDFSHMEGADLRFRCSIFMAGGGLHAAIRRVNPVIPSFDDLHLPPVYEKVADTTHEGLVVICGVTGCGKSTTLAAMIDHMNETRRCNIITIEDPVEYLIRPKKSYISQREIGIDVQDFPLALRAAVRQDPDVIMIGEMRDRETMSAGLMAAETGHTVFVTLHTADTMQSFARILEFFPSSEHTFIRSSMANGLKAVMAQRLLPSVREDVDRVPATEVLLNNSTVCDKIREGEDEDLIAVLGVRVRLAL